jgi:hypothetical protein
MYPKHSSKLCMLIILNVFHSGHKQAHSDLNDMPCQVMTSVNQSQIKLTVHKVWICFLNFLIIMKTRETIMAEETLSCALWTFAQTVLCFQNKCKTNNIGWNKCRSTVLSQVVRCHYKGFCLDVQGCCHMYKHVMTISVSERCSLYAYCCHGGCMILIKFSLCLPWGHMGEVGYSSTHS